jgi:hypothetical protein
VFPKLVFREAGMQVSPVAMSRPSLRASAPPCLLLSTEEGLEAFAFCQGLFAFCLWLFALEGFFGFWFGLWLCSFALDFLVWEAFGRENNY